LPGDAVDSKNGAIRRCVRRTHAESLAGKRTSCAGRAPRWTQRQMAERLAFTP